MRIIQQCGCFSCKHCNYHICFQIVLDYVESVHMGSYLKTNPLHVFLSVKFAHTYVNTGKFSLYSVLYTFTEYSLWISWRLPAVLQYLLSDIFVDSSGIHTCRQVATSPVSYICAFTNVIKVEHKDGQIMRGGSDICSFPCD